MVSDCIWGSKYEWLHGFKGRRFFNRLPYIHQEYIGTEGSFDWGLVAFSQPGVVCIGATRAIGGHDNSIIMNRPYQFDFITDYSAVLFCALMFCPRSVVV